MKEISYEPQEEVPQPKSVVRSRGSDIAPPMRTFSKDVSELVERERLTKAQVIMAEADRRESRGEARTHQENDNHLTYIIFGLLLMLAFGVGVGAYVLIVPHKEKEKVMNTAEVLRTERQIEIPLRDTAKEALLADVSLAYQEKVTQPKEARIAVFTMSVNGGERDATAGEVLSIATERMISESFLRSITTELSLTIYSEKIGDPKHGYVTMKAKSYPNAALGLLEWEATMGADLILLLDPRYTRSMIPLLRAREWESKRIGGADARLLKDPEGGVAIAYTIVRPNTIIIARNDTLLLSAILALTPDSTGQ
jgi:hypothetical protein